LLEATSELRVAHLSRGEDGLARGDVVRAARHVRVRVVAFAPARPLAVRAEGTVAERAPEREAVREVDEGHAALGAVQRQQLLRDLHTFTGG
jgi:hypothetical protein